MNINYLEWDSSFFDLKIGKVLYLEKNNSSSEIDEILTKSQNENYDLIYLIGNQNLKIESSLLLKHNGQLVDKKVIYEKEIITNLYEYDDVEEYKDVSVVKELEKLAFESGKFSRFRKDTNFKNTDFERLYKLWMQNSVNKQIADKIFILKREINIVAMITLKITSNCGTIGLLAVNSSEKGKGFGKKLIGASQNYLFENEIRKLNVATQLNNKIACSFYEACGFRIKDINNIFHFWLKKTD
ncbi:MAG: GNAT family N-acetyltransferase [Bacteroidota bacterium]|nr:GNAT family N-acetyltransferase [Bacteroidota bacterium]